MFCYHISKYLSICYEKLMTDIGSNYNNKCFGEEDTTSEVTKKRFTSQASACNLEACAGRVHHPGQRLQRRGLRR